MAMMLSGVGANVAYDLSIGPMGKYQSSLEHKKLFFP